MEFRLNLNPMFGQALSSRQSAIQTVDWATRREFEKDKRHCRNARLLQFPVWWLAANHCTSLFSEAAKPNSHCMQIGNWMRAEMRCCKNPSRCKIRTRWRPCEQPLLILHLCRWLIRSTFTDDQTARCRYEFYCHRSRHLDISARFACLDFFLFVQNSNFPNANSHIHKQTLYSHACTLGTQFRTHPTHWKMEEKTLAGAQITQPTIIRNLCRANFVFLFYRYSRKIGSNFLLFFATNGLQQQFALCVLKKLKQQFVKTRRKWTQCFAKFRLQLVNVFECLMQIVELAELEFEVGANYSLIVKRLMGVTFCVLHRPD